MRVTYLGECPPCLKALRLPLGAPLGRGLRGAWDTLLFRGRQGGDRGQPLQGGPGGRTRRSAPTMMGVRDRAGTLVCP